MSQKFSYFLRFRPSEAPEKGMITETAKWPLDYIFTPTASQEEVYTKFKHLADDLIQGKNGCLVLIGNKNSGRRHSIFGKFPANNGIIPRTAEEIMQSQPSLKIILTVTDINGRSLIAPKITAENESISKYETTLHEVSQKINGEEFQIPFVLYKITIREPKVNKEHFINIIQLEDTEENISSVYSMINNSNINSKLVSLLQSLTSQSEKVSVLITSTESRAETDKLKLLFFQKQSTSAQQDESEIDSLKSRVSSLEKEVRSLKEDLIESQRKSHEYYENYHRTLLLINKDSAQNVFLNSQNESLIRQIRKETSLLQSLESKYQSLIDGFSKSHESTHLEFDSCFNSFIKPEVSVELNVTDTLNLGISQVKLAISADPSIDSPYSSELKQALEGNSELNKEVKILQLKNQLIEASVINANMSRMLSSFDWKFSMLKHRYEMKRLLSKQQQERIKSLEEMIEYLHESFQVFKSTKKGEEKDIEKMFDRYCYRAIVDSQRLVAESKKNMQDIEKKATDAYRRESQKWIDLLSEHKENYEKELTRKQAEVIRLNELLGKWVNKFMELQETLDAGEKPLGVGYYNKIQELVRETIRTPLDKVSEKLMTPKAKSLYSSQRFGVISGDVNLPID